MTQAELANSYSVPMGLKSRQAHSPLLLRVRSLKMLLQPWPASPSELTGNTRLHHTLTLHLLSARVWRGRRHWGICSEPQPPAANPGSGPLSSLTLSCLFRPHLLTAHYGCIPIVSAYTLQIQPHKEASGCPHSPRAAGDQTPSKIIYRTPLALC